MRCANRKYLLLQGPHGPFFADLAAHLRREGAQVWKIGLNAGDAAEWRGPGYVQLHSTGGVRDAKTAALMRTHAITDLVLYGDKRPFHANALAAARARGIRCHILEEGYLRPYWITYERHGSNLRSPAATWDLDRLREQPPCPEPYPAARWGALRHHIIFGALYHLHLLLGSAAYPAYRSHRKRSVVAETAQSLGAFLGLPLAMAWRSWTQAGIVASQKPLFVVLMQLEHDSAVADSAACSDHETLLDRTMAAFAAHAAPDARLVIKMHPLEARRLAVARLTRKTARRHGVTNRVSCLPGGRLAPLLNRATAVVTVNSTAGQQALWRGLPVFCFGPSVYAHPHLLSAQSLAEFMARPCPPDTDLYARFRAFLFRTSQLPGSFYAPSGRKQAIGALLQRMTAATDPYDLEAAVADHDTTAPLIRQTGSGQVAVQ